MSRETYELPNGKTLHRWTNPTGDRWACAAYDHGAFCRQCVPVDDVMDACLQNVVDGLFEIRRQIGGIDFELRMTDEGDRQAGILISRIADEGPEPPA